MKKLGAIVLASTLCGCTTTYMMEVGDTFEATAASEDLNKSAQAQQSWFGSVHQDYAYITIQSRVRLAKNSTSLHAALGCEASLTSLTSKQQEFSLTASRSLSVEWASAPKPQSFPLFGFMRSDPTKTCKLADRTIYLGPPSVMDQSAYLVHATVKASTQTTVQTANLWDVVGKVADAIPIGGTPLVGAAAQAGVSSALKTFDAYVSKNLSLHVTDEVTLLEIHETSIRSGKLVYSADLTITKRNLEGSTRLNVGTLYLTVDTRLSLLTDAIIGVASNSIRVPPAGSNAPIDHLRFLPQFTSPMSLWDKQVLPLTGNSLVSLRNALDQVPGNVSSAELGPRLTSLTKAAAAGNPRLVKDLCKDIRQRAVQLRFNIPDTLAIAAVALQSTQAWSDGAPELRKGAHGCFEPYEIRIIEIMGLKAGNDAGDV